MTNRQQYVSFQGVHSGVLDIDCGVPQGSVLGPLLFLIYMNDLPSCLSHSRVILFADDTTLFASSSDLKVLYDNVNTDLKCLLDWFRANKLSLNTNKTNYLLISPNRNYTNDYLVMVGDDKIEKKACCKFLGLMIDDQLRWTDHILYIHSKLSKSLYALNRSKNLVPCKYIKTMYESLFHSYISYGITLWGSAFKTQLNRLQVLQKKAIRCVYKAPYNDHTLPLFQKGGLLYLNELYEFEVSKCMYNVYHSTLPKPLIDIYQPNIRYMTTLHDREIILIYNKDAL